MTMDFMDIDTETNLKTMDHDDLMNLLMVGVDLRTELIEDMLIARDDISGGWSPDWRAKIVEIDKRSRLLREELRDRIKGYGYSCVFHGHHDSCDDTCQCS